MNAEDLIQKINNIIDWLNNLIKSKIENINDIYNKYKNKKYIVWELNFLLLEHLSKAQKEFIYKNLDVRNLLLLRKIEEELLKFNSNTDED